MVSAASPTTPCVPTLLIVDDQASVRVSLEFLLTDSGYRILCAGSGAEAIARMSADRVDGALIDVHMPVMNGFETCERLRAAAANLNRALPVWFMTGAGGVAVEKRCCELGALAVFSKPFDPPQLLAHLQAGFASVVAPIPGVAVTS